MNILKEMLLLQEITDLSSRIEYLTKWTGLPVSEKVQQICCCSQPIIFEESPLQPMQDIPLDLMIKKKLLFHPTVDT